MGKSTFDELFMSDEKKAENGVTVVIGQNAKDRDVSIVVAEAGSNRHEKVQRKYSKQLENCRRKTSTRERLLAQIVAEAILISWSGVLGDDGKQIEPTIENKTAYLLKYKKFYQKVLEIANDTENFIDDNDSDHDDGAEVFDEAEETEKN